MKHLLKSAHFFLLFAAVMCLGTAVFSPYFYHRGVSREPCFTARRNEDTTVLVFKVKLLRNTLKSKKKNLVSFNYADSIAPFRRIEKARVQRYIEKHSIFYAPCSFEAFKKQLFEQNIFFWQDVESIWLGIKHGKELQWLPLTGFVRSPGKKNGQSMERYIFFYPAAMDFLGDSSGVIRFFDNYFLDKVPFAVDRPLRYGTGYLKIILKAQIPEAKTGCGQCK